MTVADQINLLDLGLFEREEAHAAFRVLRQEAPGHWKPGNTDHRGLRALTTSADIKYVSSHREQFISSKGLPGPGLRNPQDIPDAQAFRGGVSIITMDPPRHVKMRRLVNRGFTPRAVNAMEPRIREI